MNKRRGSALIFGLLVITVLSILSASYLYKSVSESFLSQRYVQGTDAIWYAEAGLAYYRNNNGAVGTHDIGKGSFTVAKEGSTWTTGGHIYQKLLSTGTSQDGVQRTIQAVVETDEPDASKFKYAIEVDGTLTTKGSVSITANPTSLPAPYSLAHLTGGINFSDRFGMSADDFKSISTVYTTVPEDFGNGSDYGVYWLEGADPTVEMVITGNLTGKGVLICKGKTRIAGTVTFDGIIYIMGEMRMATGTPVLSGAVVVDDLSEVTIENTDLKGNPTLVYDPAKIQLAMNALANAKGGEIVAWQEINE